MADPSPHLSARALKTMRHAEARIGSTNADRHRRTVKRREARVGQLRKAATSGGAIPAREFAPVGRALPERKRAALVLPSQ
jgi:hypothetical protein